MKMDDEKMERLLKASGDLVDAIASILADSAEDDDYITLNEVRRIVPGIDSHKLKRLAKNGVLRSRQISERRMLYHRKDVSRIFGKCSQ